MRAYFDQPYYSIQLFMLF